MPIGKIAKNPTLGKRPDKDGRRPPIFRREVAPARAEGRNKMPKKKGTSAASTDKFPSCNAGFRVSGNVTSGQLPFSSQPCLRLCTFFTDHRVPESLWLAW